MKKLMVLRFFIETNIILSFWNKVEVVGAIISNGVLIMRSRKRVGAVKKLKKWVVGSWKLKKKVV